MRTEAEVIKAIRYVGFMADMAHSSAEVNEMLSPEEMRIIRISSARVFEVLDWVLGEDNKFGEMVKRAPIPAKPDESAAGDNLFGHRSRTKPRRRRRRADP